ncbi:MAG: DNA mismatch repair protein [Candelina submexicana]|nr:MAG: DNA mismatch repair protein [Candelina submexicana]
MTSRTPTILPLQAEVAAEIKSSTTITSLTSVVLDLLRNSLDAEATKVDIVVDFPRGGCTIEDNGHGISPAEFHSDGGLGRMHYTSKYNSPTTVHGRAGRFLASLAALALVTITSQHARHRSHNSLILHHSKPIARLVPAPAHHHLIAQEHGTRVLVQDLFGNMPVRVKQRAVAFRSLPESEKEWDLLKRGVVGLLLGWGKSVEVIVRDASRNKKFAIAGQGTKFTLMAESEQGKHGRPVMPIFLKSVRSILSRAGYISPESWDSWISSSARSSLVKVQGAISLDPAPTKRIQFISCGICPMTVEGGNNELYDEVNRIFAASSFGVVEEDAEVPGFDRQQSSRETPADSRGYTQKQLKGGRKGVDRWPMFFLSIDLMSTKSRMQMSEEHILENENLLGAILKVLGALVTAFLKEHHFRPRLHGARHPAVEAIHDLKLTEATNGAVSRQQSVREIQRSAARERSLDDPLPEGKRLSGIPSASIHRLASNTTTISCAVRSSPSVSGNAKITPPDPGRSVSTGSGININSWRRIKSGKQAFLDHLYNINLESCPTSHMSKPQSVVGQVQPCTPHTVEYSLSQASSRNITDENAAEHGKADTQSTPRPSGDSIHRAGEFSIHTDCPASHSADEIIPWTNPVSKATLLINARTGLQVIPSQRRESSSSLLSESASPKSPVSPWPNKRLRLAQRRTAIDNSKPAGEWIGSMLKDWQNPVFRLTEEPFRRASLFDTSQEYGGRHQCVHSNLKTVFQDIPASISGRLSKEGLLDAEVIAQVDKKFILITMGTASINNSTEPSNTLSNRTLVLIDQHAADERCRVEALFEELCAPVVRDMTSPKKATDSTFTPKTRTTSLEKPIKFCTSAEECRLLRLYAEHFANWGVLYDVSEGLGTMRQNEGLGGAVFVKALPLGIAERSKAEPRMLIELMRAEIWKRNEVGCHSGVDTLQVSEVNGNLEGGEKRWLSRIRDCPEGIVEMLNSRACRSAIMFNDVLSLDECRVLLNRLAKCAFPFQCAHGRPSMVPLLGLEGLAFGDNKSHDLFPRDPAKEGKLGLDFADRCMRWRNSIMGAKDREGRE